MSYILFGLKIPRDIQHFVFFQDNSKLHNVFLQISKFTKLGSTRLLIKKLLSWKVLGFKICIWNKNLQPKQHKNNTCEPNNNIWKINFKCNMQEALN